MVSRAIVPAAGLGTRMLTATKETPKEMLPIFSMGVNGGVCVKPTLQVIFESLFDVCVSRIRILFYCWRWKAVAVRIISMLVVVMYIPDKCIHMGI